MAAVDPSVADVQAQSRIEAADLIVAYLEQLGVEYVFGVPGGAIEPLYNALARSARRGGPRPIVARHETGAAFMADGYTRITGRLGVCCSTTGPGATNLITGVSSAYDNNIPMLVITAQTALNTFGKGAIQESSCTGVNTVGMFQYCTRYNTLVSHPEQLERKLASAVLSAFQSPAGPAHLSIPLDILRGPAPVSSPSFDLAALLRRPSLMDEDAVERLCQALTEARRPVIVIGDGCSEAIGTLLEVALLLEAQVLTTPHGKGLVSPYHPLFRGVIGFAGHRSAERVLEDPGVDLVVAVGTGLGEFESNAWDERGLLNRRLVHVESTEGHLTRSPMARLHVRGRILSIFERVKDHLLERGYATREDLLEGARRSVWGAPASGEAPRRHFELDDEDKCRDEGAPIKPQRLMTELTRLFPPSTRYFADTGSSLAWTIHYLHPYDRRVAGRRDAHGGLYRTCVNFASMGWAIGASVGAAVGARGTPVVCIVGDGAMLMSGQEITVALQERVPVVFVVLNDGALGMVKHGQRLGGAERIGTELPETDFAAMARAMGVPGHVIRSPQDLEALDVAAICARPGPTLLDVRIDPEEIPPMGKRVRVLQGKA
ncbi:thiamine pyrophosphate-binding protein [Inmirania thermothiophila]|uniref:Acetolactate synthase-1/2/3 large subunit n=1 Tax=Inmirania thermothiophila TaxID=1750597 RepID=A0A3N1Y411_9GAMM|nr:thiamine pyrophosphate-binding protein [Inmirania thermothiophila]ROR32017.1 acetolactate synthase-1/2/3 large subunit [Inmirania thermothiophila]